MMNEKSIPVKSAGLMERVLADDVVVLSQKGDILHTFSGSARFIWERIDGNSPLEAIALMMKEEYKIDERKALSDLLSFIDELEKKSLAIIKEK